MSARKAYRPRQASNVAGINKLAMASALSQAEIDALALRVHGANAVVRAGHAAEQNMADIAAAINTSMVLCERAGNNAEALQIVFDAQDALLRAQRHHQHAKRWCLDGPGIGQVAAALSLYEQLLGAVTALQLTDAIREAWKRADAGLVLTVEAA
jgi:hypothetical protein